MLIRIHPDNPDPRGLMQIIRCLRDGGVVVYPTDTVYGIGCDITNQTAMEKILRFKDINLKKTNLSMICEDISQASQFVKPIENSIFKLMKRNTPGAFTFILNASNNIPKLFKANKKTVGIRIPDNKIVRSIVSELGNPILSTSVKNDDDDTPWDEYLTDPSLIQERLDYIADIVIDGGMGGIEGSTVVDCTSSSYSLIRQGKGILIEQ
ncbi:MAG: threonylcarbamoyl-AMP synthase [Marinilabiliaceae bacterium]|nr:threonylcarbamoyl-AMP synthase [Marinilabiliaceae bacterium]